MFIKIKTTRPVFFPILSHSVAEKRAAVFCTLIAALAILAFAAPARADYYAQGVMQSTDLLSGVSDAAQITGFRATTTIPASTTVSAQFSLNGTDWYTSLGIKGGWETFASGTNLIDLRALDWATSTLGTSTLTFYYRLQLTTASSTLAPAVDDAELVYASTYSPYTAPWDGGYFSEGALLSTNLLASSTDVAQITGFTANSTVPASTTLAVQYSQNQTDWYNSQGIKGGWDTLSSGATSYDITALNWTTADLYYHLKFTSASSTAASMIDEARVDYADTYTSPVTGTGFYATGTIASTDLLAGSGQKLNGDERFGYEISSLPAGTAVRAQFSRDNASWYNSAGSLWGWDTLSAGEHLNVDAALDLRGTGFATGTSFYYRLELSTNNSSLAPVVSEVRLVRRTTTVSPADHPGDSKTIINSSQNDRMTSGLVGLWSFNGPDISGATAYDRSGGGHNGTIFGAKPAIGKNGQALYFDGTASYASLGNVGAGIKTIAFWMRAEAITNRKILDIDGTRQIEINGASQVVATGWPAATVYVDGIATSSINADWHFITVIDSIGVNATAADLGRVGAGYFKGRVDELRLYDRAMAGTEIDSLYRLGQGTMKR